MSMQANQVPPVSILRPGKYTHLRRYLGPVIVLLAALVAIAPQLLHGPSCGHDFNFHLVSWFDALNSWRHGLLYPHWAASANYGAGEPRFVFYPPLTWMLGASLGLLLPWSLVPVALTFLLLAATGLATRALARQALADAPATLAGCASIFSGYALFTAYERSAFAELAGGFWIPLLLLFMLRDRNPEASAVKRALDGSAAPLALVVAGVWLSNVPLGVMAFYLLAAGSLALALLQRAWWPLLRAAVGAGVGLALAAIYLLPAAWQQHWVDIRQATEDPGLMIQNSWLFARHAEPLLQLHDVELRRVSTIAVIMVAVSLASLLVIWWRGILPPKSRSHARRWWSLLAAIPFVVLFLQFPLSQPVWNLLPRFRFLQFPWRLLVVLDAPMAILFAAALWPRKPARRYSRAAVIAICAATFLAAAAFAGKSFFQPCDDEDNVPAMAAVYNTGAGFEGVGEYEPPGADNSLLPTGLPVACLIADPSVVLGKVTEDGVVTEDSVPAWSVEQGSCLATFAAATGPDAARPEHLRLIAAPFRAGFMVLRLRSYPAWAVRVNGQPVASLPHRDDGLMAVPVPAGPVDLSVDWTTTPDSLVGRWLSVLGVLLLTALCLLEQKRSHARLS